MLVNIQHFLNEKGQGIEAHYEHGPVIPTPIRFIGRAQAVINGGRSMPISFEIPAATIEEAFDNYEQCMNEKGKELEEQMRIEARRQMLTRPVR